MKRDEKERENTRFVNYVEMTQRLSDRSPHGSVVLRDRYMLISGVGEDGHITVGSASDDIGIEMFASANVKPVRVHDLQEGKDVSLLV